MGDLLRLSITLTINNDKIARFHLSPPLRVTPPRPFPTVVGRNKPPGPALACHRAGQRPDPVGRPDDKLRALRRSGPPLLLPPSTQTSLGDRIEMKAAQCAHAYHS